MSGRIDVILRLVPQSKLSKMMGVDPSYTSRILNGERTPSPRMLVALRDALNRLISEEHVSPILTDELVEWLDIQSAIREHTAIPA